ncbi:hypothetical protein [Actinomadura formosensis]|uniref:hypothetical protein n=1 Tax=Actinomadura formosensis TaxID=60706 RepID=UPI003D917462
MMFLGFLLVAIVIAVGAGVVLDNTDAAHLVVFGQAVPGLNNEWQVFLAGAGMALVLVLGMTLTVVGAARRIRTRRDLRDLRDEHKESLTTLEMEKRRLERELARVRQGTARRSGQREPAAPPQREQGPAAQRGPAAAPQGVRAGSRSQVSAASPFFERNE